MESSLKYRIILYCFFLFARSLTAQNETSKWYFGNYAGLDFMTNPPTTLTNNAMQANYGCASVADAAGNLLFYTSGLDIYNSSHTIMPNGSGLNGPQNASQPVLIIKRPGNATQYYIFTLNPSNSNFSLGLHYSIVDMSLAAGQGSVITKNASLYSGYCGGKLTGTRHCNGTDYWVVIRDWNTNSTAHNFRSYQLTSTGISTVAVLSAANSFTNNYYYDQWGCMKISPNGKKLALANYNNYYYSGGQNHSFELHDFDNSTGVVSNSLALGSWTSSSYYYNGGWGVEFSPDGTKLYGSRLNNYYYNNNGTILQWNLCAGSPTAIAASETAIATATTNVYNGHGSMQLAKNGKIYIAHWYNTNQQAISVINNPNALGSACNYTYMGQSISPKSSTYSLPNFVGSYFAQPPPVAPFTFSVSNGYGCQAASFTSPATPNTTVSACATIGYSLVSLKWDFGDPASGSSNTTTVTNPVHAFTSLGTYTVKLILNYSCGGGTDTLSQLVNINLPCISVTSSSITCASLGSATVSSTGGIGPFSFTWMPSGQTSSVATGLSPGTYTLTVFDFGNNFTYTATTVFTSLIPLTGDVSYSSSLTCNGVNTGTANVTNFAGGSGTVNYVWAGNATTYTVPNPTTLGAGVWSITVTDSLTGCTIKEIFQITQPPPLSLAMSASTPSSCVGTSVTVSGITSGGTPGYTYSWTAGPAADSMVVAASTGGIYQYTLNSYDANSCLVKNTVTVNFVDNPVLVVANASICPLQTGTVAVSGASTYTWNDNSTASSLADNPMVTTTYTVVGAALGCTSVATASIVLKPLPQPLVSSNSPRCNGDNLQLFAIGGASYYWQGPQNYAAGQQNPIITAASTLQAGVYNVTVTAANSCTASLSTTVIVHPTPTVSAWGSTVCVNQPLNLYGSSISGATFFWKGPSGYASVSQNPVIASPAVFQTGVYSLTVTSAFGCTNAASAHGSVTALPVPAFIHNSPLCFGETLQLNAGSTTGAESFSWSGPNGFVSSQQNNTISNITVPASGVYSLLVTAGPCTASVGHAVVVNPLPVPIIISNNPVCETKTLKLDAVTPNFNIVTYIWTGPGGFVSVLKNPEIQSAALSHSGTYSVSVKDINGCASSAYLIADIMPNPTVTASGTIVCRYDAATLTAEGAVAYDWWGPSLVVTSGSAAVVGSAGYDTPQLYKVTGTAANGCTAVATASVATRVLPVPTIVVSPKSRLCTGEQAILKGTGGFNYKWAGPLNHTYSGETVTVPLVYQAQSGEYTLTVEDLNRCKGSATATLHVDPAPQGGLLGNRGSCAPFCADYVFDSPLSTASLVTAKWEINKQTFSGKKFSYCFTKPGRYNVNAIFTDTANGCRSAETFVVEAYAQPVADFQFSPEEPVENTDEVLFTNSSAGADITRWHWSISGENVSVRQENVSHLFRDAGVYAVALVITDARGCADTVVRTISVAHDFNIYVPNAFTPNGDNHNETFLPSVRGVRLYDLKIFNRWGDQLFHTADPGTGWDGTLRGEACKEEVYVWQIVLTNLQGERKKYNGHVTLYR